MPVHRWSVRGHYVAVQSCIGDLKEEIPSVHNYSINEGFLKDKQRKDTIPKCERLIYFFFFDISALVFTAFLAPQPRCKFPVHIFYQCGRQKRLWFRCTQMGRLRENTIYCRIIQGQWTKILKFVMTPKDESSPVPTGQKCEFSQRRQSVHVISSGLIDFDRYQTHTILHEQ